MDADYSLELGPMAPALEIPWQDPEGKLHYVELRGDSDSLNREVLCEALRTNVARIPEAQRFPALARFLIAVNLPPSPWQTAKCDVLPDEAEADENLYGRSFEQSCYVDLILAGNASALRPSLEVHQRLAQELAHSLETNEVLEATAEIVVRRCYFHKDGETEESDAGYCLTLFLSAYGSSPADAALCWEEAMDFAAGCILKLHPHEGCTKA
jgi:hypothetical protein